MCIRDSTFFAGAKKVSKEDTWNTTRRAVVPVDTGRCAPAGGAHGLAQQALYMMTCEIAADPWPTRWTSLTQSGARKKPGLPANVPRALALPRPTDRAASLGSLPCTARTFSERSEARGATVK